MKFIKNFIKNEEGLTIVEYAVAASLISVFLIVAFQNLGTAIQNTINDLIAIL